jgi:hypothetical protein
MFLNQLWIITILILPLVDQVKGNKLFENKKKRGTVTDQGQ